MLNCWVLRFMPPYRLGVVVLKPSVDGVTYEVRFGDWNSQPDAPQLLLAPHWEGRRQSCREFSG